MAATDTNGLTHYHLKVPQEIVVWVDDTFDNNF